MVVNTGNNPARAAGDFIPATGPGAGGIHHSLSTPVTPRPGSRSKQLLDFQSHPDLPPLHRTLTPLTPPRSSPPPPSSLNTRVFLFFLFSFRCSFSFSDTWNSLFFPCSSTVVFPLDKLLTDNYFHFPNHYYLLLCHTFRAVDSEVALKSQLSRPPLILLYLTTGSAAANQYAKYQSLLERPS